MEIWAIIVLSLALLIVLLLLILVLKTLTFKSRQVVVSGRAGEPINIDGSAARLAAAIQIKTISNLDRSQVDYTRFTHFHTFLEKSFPLVHSTLDKQVINEYGLVYTCRTAGK